MVIIQQPLVRIRVRVAVALTAALALTGCAGDDESLIDETPQGPQEVVTIGVAMASPGLISGMTPQNLSGTEVELVTAVTDRMETLPPEAELEWIPTRADTVADELANGDLDLAIGQFSEADVTAAAGRIGPYATVQAGLLVHQSPAEDDTELVEVLQPTRVDSLAELADASVCVVAGSAAENADAGAGVTEATVAECEVGMRSGRYDALAADDLQLAGLLMDPALAARYELMSWPDLIAEGDEDDPDVDEALFDSDEYWIGVASHYCADAGEAFETAVTDGVIDDLFQAWDDIAGLQVQPVDAEDVTAQHCDTEV